MRLAFNVTVHSYDTRPTAPGFRIFFQLKRASRKHGSERMFTYGNAMKLPLALVQCGSMEAKALSFVLHAAGSEHHKSCGSMEAKLLSLVLRAADDEHHKSSTRRVFAYVVGWRVGMNDTCYFTLDMKKLDPTTPQPHPISCVFFLFVLCFGFGVFVALLCFCFLFCKCFGIPNSPRSLDLDDRQGLIASSAMQQKKNHPISCVPSTLRSSSRDSFTSHTTPLVA